MGALREDLNASASQTDPVPTPGTSWDLLILGAGASGLMCAIEAGKRGRQVLVLDHGALPGRKIRLAGGGRCNFTNLQVGREHYLSENPRFTISALRRFPPRAFVDLLEGYGFPYEDKGQGRLFGKAPASRIVTILLDECRSAGVRFALGRRTEEVGGREGAFRVRTEAGTHLAAALVVATGGCSYPQAGATGLGYRIARDFGHAVVEPRPGLVGLLWEEHDAKRFGPLAGLSIFAEVRCRQAVFRDGLLFTHRGLSGPAVMQASSYWRPGDILRINLAPERDLASWLKEHKRLDPRLALSSALAGLFPSRLISVMLREEGQGLKLGALSDTRLAEWAARFSKWLVLPGGTEGLAKAEVTAGGVDTRELSSRTMESRRVKGLYFVGEVMDVTGQLGGFNLHWAWASGFCAGQEA